MSITRTLAAVTFILATTACGDSNEVPFSAPDTDPASTTSTMAPSPETSESPAPQPVDSTDPGPTTSTTAPPPETSAPSAPRPMNRSGWLAPGHTYRSEVFTVPLQVSTPDTTDGRWRLMADFESQIFLTLGLPPTDGVPRTEPPMVVIGAPPSHATADDIVDVLLEWAGETDGVELDREDGDYLGRPVPVVRGGSSVVAPSGLQYFGMPLWDEGGFAMSYGERAVLVYLVPVGDRVIAVKFEAHPLEWDRLVTHATALLESVEWT
jgi:hypothetical protein